MFRGTGGMQSSSSDDDSYDYIYSDNDGDDDDEEEEGLEIVENQEGMESIEGEEVDPDHLETEEEEEEEEELDDELTMAAKKELGVYQSQLELQLQLPLERDATRPAFDFPYDEDKDRNPQSPPGSEMTAVARQEQEDLDYAIALSLATYDPIGDDGDGDDDIVGSDRENEEQVPLMSRRKPRIVRKKFTPQEMELLRRRKQEFDADREREAETCTAPRRIVRKRFNQQETEKDEADPNAQCDGKRGGESSSSCSSCSSSGAVCDGGDNDWLSHIQSIDDGDSFSHVQVDSIGDGDSFSHVQSEGVGDGDSFSHVKLESVDDSFSDVQPESLCDGDSFSHIKLESVGDDDSFSIVQPEIQTVSDGGDSEIFEMAFVSCELVLSGKGSLDQITNESIEQCSSESDLTRIIHLLQREGKSPDLIFRARIKRIKMKREANREPNRETLLELSSTNIHKVIEDYSRKHPDDLGMPINEFTKRFGISTSNLNTDPDLVGTGTSTMNSEQESLIFKDCILETVEGLGRVLILRDETENTETNFKEENSDQSTSTHSTSLKPKVPAFCDLSVEYIENCRSVSVLRHILILCNNQYPTPTQLRDAARKQLQALGQSWETESRKLPPWKIGDSLTLEYIQNCCSVAELREILLRLDQPDDPRRDLVISANVRKATLLMMDDGIFDLDSLSLDYIEKCGSVPILQYIMYKYQRRLPTFHDAAKKRLEAVSPFGEMFNPFFGSTTLNPDPVYQTTASNDDVQSFDAPTLEKPPENKTSEDADYMLALQMSMDYGEDEAVFWNILSEPYDSSNTDFAVNYIDSCNSTTEVKSIITYLEDRPTLGTTLIQCAKERLRVLHQYPQSKQDFWQALNEPYEFDPGSLVKYVENCDSIQELESMLLRVNTGWRSMLLQPVKKRLETLKHYNYVSIAQVAKKSEDFDEIRSRSQWSYHHNDIELGETLKMHPGNCWLTNMIKLEFDSSYFLTRFADNQSFHVKKIIKKAKAEGRQFFSLTQSVGVVWVDTDDIAVTEEIHRCFRRERMIRFRKGVRWHEKNSSFQSGTNK